jgi:prepilin-type N-terminal cleavage/methylation domain-containing protein
MIMHRSIQTRHDRARAFTITELLIVMVLLSILSATALPALSRLDDAQRAGLLNECERMITLSQSHAISTGVPSGVRFDLARQTATVVAIDPIDARVQPVTRVGSGQPHSLLAGAFPGARLTGAGPIAAPTSIGTETIWFDFDGTPQRREPNGGAPVELTGEFVVEVEEAARLRILPWSGRIVR